LEPRDVIEGEENIDIVVLADGVVLGGMRYFVDRNLREVKRTPDPHESAR